MSGLLRRFRRGKPKEEDESEPTEAPEAAREGDSDIYPHRGPTKTKRTRDEPEPEVPPRAVEEGGEVAPLPVELPEEIGPPPEEPASVAVPAPPTVEPAVELPSGAPPKLPEAGSGASRSVHRPLSTPTHCFLCGAEMSGSFCPTCRMTWNE